MKQRITPEQLAELTDEQKEWLRVWWNPQIGDWYADWNQYKKIYKESLYFEVDADDYHSNIPDKENTDLPLLSIGQMVELLHDKGTFYQITADAVEDDMVCHVLWRAVKSVLYEVSHDLTRMDNIRISHNRK